MFTRVKSPALADSTLATSTIFKSSDSDIPSSSLGTSPPRRNGPHGADFRLHPSMSRKFSKVMKGSPHLFHTLVSHGNLGV